MTRVPSVTVIDITIKQLGINASIIILLPEVICCLQTCNVTRSEAMVGDTCVPSFTAINQLEIKISI